MKIGGQILWNVTPICETFKISCLMGRPHTKGRTIESFPLVHWLSFYPISAKDQSRIHQFGKKVLPGLFLGYALYAGGIWKGDMLVADIEELETMDASETYSKKTQCEKGDTSKRKWKIHVSSRRWTSQIPWRRSGTANTHLDTGTPNSRRKSKRFSLRIRRVSPTTSRLMSGCR